MSSIAFPAEWGIQVGPSCKYDRLSPRLDDLVKRSESLESKYSAKIDFIDFCFRIGEEFGNHGVEEAEYSESGRSLGVDIIINQARFQKLSKEQIFKSEISLAAEKIASLGIRIDSCFLADVFLEDVQMILEGHFPV